MRMYKYFVMILIVAAIVTFLMWILTVADAFNPQALYSTGDVLCHGDYRGRVAFIRRDGFSIMYGFATPGGLVIKAYEEDVMPCK